MKFIQTALVLSVLVAPFVTHAEDNDICGPVFKACAAQGFAKDETAPAGKKIWADCADVLINQKKSVATVNVDPKSFEATNCGAYRKAKDKFDAEWIKKHPKP